jgi:cytidine deaminase
VKYDALVKAARKAKQYSHSPYSKFRVGAALLTSTGKIVTGCNIENSSFSLTICAERTALFKSISEGVTKFQALAISSDSDQFIPPCGACRQVIQDLAGDIDIILSTKRGKTLVTRLRDLLPMPFDQSLLTKHR